MRETLTLPPGHDGAVWRHEYRAQTRAPHSHAELELNMTVRGHATYLLGERRVDLRPGTLVWLFPAQGHVLLNETADHAAWIGVFSPRLLERVCTTPATLALRDPDPPGAFCKSLLPSDAQKLETMLAELASPAHAPDAALLNVGLGYVLLTAWEAFGRAGAHAPGRVVHPAVEAAARRIKSDPEAVNLDVIAEAAGLSVSRLGRLFRAQLGVSVPDFRNAQRLERFLRLLSEPGYLGSLLEAALDAGWGSYAQFHREWTRRMGCSPARFRRQSRDADDARQYPPSAAERQP